MKFLFFVLAMLNFCAWGNPGWGFFFLFLFFCTSSSSSSSKRR